MIQLGLIIGALSSIVIGVFVVVVTAAADPKSLLVLLCIGVAFWLVDLPRRRRSRRRRAEQQARYLAVLAQIARDRDRFERDRAEIRSLASRPPRSSARSGAPS